MKLLSNQEPHPSSQWGSSLPQALACVALGAALSLVGPSLTPDSVSAQVGPGMDPNGTESFELGAFLGLINDQPEFSPDLNRDQFRRDALIGGRLGYTFRSNLFVQAEASNALVQIVFDDAGASNTRSTNGFFGNLNLGYNFQPTQDLQVFGLAGAGAVLWDADLPDREVQLQLNYGVGVRYFVTPRVAVRTDLRMHHVPSALESLRSDLAERQVANGTLYAAAATFGLSLFTEGSSDGDADGVRDSRDQCPGTRPGALAGPNGCPLDSDRDGVPNGIDQCPNTPAGAEVGLDGCPADSDSDGVLNGIDQCPDTTTTRVNREGCPVGQEPPASVVRIS